MFVVGIDIAKRSHEAIVLDADGNVIVKPFSFNNSCVGFNKLMDVLGKLCAEPDDFVFGMEATGQYWLALHSRLKKQGYRVHVLNPIQTDALRNVYIRQTKNDMRDSFVIAEVIRFGRYSETGMQSSDLYALREMCRARVYLVSMQSDLKHKTVSLLDQTFPEYETIFSDTVGLTSTAVLLNCPTPEVIINISTKRLTKIVSQASNKRFGIAKAEELQRIARDSFGINVSSEAFGMLIKQHIQHIQFIDSQIKEIETQIKQMFSMFDSQLTSITGVGAVLSAIILSEIGDISRFSSAAKLAAFAGIDPTVKQSGEFTGVKNHMSKRGSPYLRHAIWLASTVAANHDPAIKAYYQKKRAEGKSYLNSIGHVCRKMVSIIYAVMRDNTPLQSPVSEAYKE